MKMIRSCIEKLEVIMDLCIFNDGIILGQSNSQDPEVISNQSLGARKKADYRLTIGYRNVCFVKWFNALISANSNSIQTSQQPKNETHSLPERTFIGHSSSAQALLLSILKFARNTSRHCNLGHNQLVYSSECFQ